MEEHSFEPHFIPKHIVKEWNLPKKIVQKRKSKKKYFENNPKKKELTFPVINVRSSVIKKEELILPLRKYIKEREKTFKKSVYCVPLRQQYKIEANNLYLRTFIQDTVDDVITVLDTDKSFFQIVDGRPLSHHTAYYKTYQDIYRKTLMLKQEAGYMKDHILNMESKANHELIEYENSNEMCKDQAKHLDGYILEDYSKSIRLIRIAEAVRFSLHQVGVEYRNLSTQIGYLRSKILGLHDKYSLQKRYQRFLFVLSPSSWQISNTITEADFSYSDLSAVVDDSFSVIFERMETELAHGPPQEPALYFDDPDGMMDVYNFVENRNFASLEHVTRTSRAARRLRDVAREVREVIAHEHSLVEGVIAELVRLIDEESERANLLEAKFYRIVHGPLYECVAATDVLKLRTNLEYCFERLSGEQPSDVSMRGMAKFLEDLNLECLRGAEGMSGLALKRALVASTAADRSTLKQAVAARKELRALDRVTERLQRAVSPARWRRK